MKTRHHLTVAVVLGFAAAQAAAQQPAVVLPVLTGHIQTIDGIPVAEAEVKIEDLRAAATRSDTRGAFSIPNVPKGIHTISVRRLGYLPTTATVEVPQKNDSLTIVLVPTRAELRPAVHVIRARQRAGGRRRR